MSTAAAVAAALAAVAVAASASAPQLDLDRSPAIYLPGQAPRLHCTSPDAAVVSLRDWRGRLLQRRDLSPGATDLDLPQLPVGYYEIALTASAAAQTRAFAVLEAAPAPSATFGVMTHFAQGWSTDIVPLIARAGIGTVRDEQYWQQLEPRPGSYAQPAAYAQYLAALQQAGIEPLLVLSFANAGYDGGQTPYTPAGRAAFAAYAAALARRTAGQVSAFEVWNEFNGSFCSGPCQQDRPASYAALLATTATALAAENPRLTVVGGAAVKVPLPWFEALLAHGAAAHWNAVAVHPYREPPEGAGQDIAALRQLLQAAGSTAPIWATEFGSGAGHGDAAARRDTAAYLVRMAVVLRAAGVQRMYWYLLRDYASFAGMGLLRAATDPLGRYAPTPAYAAYATLIRQLDGAAAPVREATDLRSHVYRFTRAGQTTYVLWAPDGPLPASAQLPAGGLLTDLVGGARRLPAGRSTLQLEPTPQYLTGLVQELAAPRPDVLLAAAGAEAPPEAAAWQYGAYLQPPGTPAAGSVLAPDALRALRPQTNAWEHFWGERRWPQLRVGAETLHPARDQGRAVWAVRRYRSAAGGTLWLRGRFTRPGRGDGSGVRILLDGKTVFAALLSHDGGRQAPFDLRLVVPPGGRVDFVVTPGPALDVTDDAVALQAWLSRPRDGS